MLASFLKRDLRNLIQRDASPNFQDQNGLLSLRSWWRSVRSLFFFRPFQGGQSCATRLIPLPVAPIAPGVVAVGTRAWPARLDPLGHLLRVPTCACARYSVTAPLRRLGSATFCIRLEARDTSHEACCDSSIRTAPESGGETSPDRHSPRSASIQLRWLPCPSSRPPENPIPTKQKSYFDKAPNAMSRATRNPPRRCPEIT